MVDEVLAELRELRARVESLEVDNARLRDGRASAVAPEAESGVTAATGDGVSRRGLLKKVGGMAAAGAGLAVGESLLRAGPAFAGTDGDLALGGRNDAGSSITTLTAANQTVALAVSLNSPTTIGEPGFVNGAVSSATDAPVPAMHGSGLVATGVLGDSYGSNGVTGQALTTGNVFNLVYGRTQGTGNGVFGEVTNTDGTGQRGARHPPGSRELCVRLQAGRCDGRRRRWLQPDRQQPRVLGVSTNGRGGAFSGKQAQVQLLASTATSHPSSGARGDLFVDNSGRLWFCKGGTTWRQLA